MANYPAEYPTAPYAALNDPSVSAPPRQPRSDAANNPPRTTAQRQTPQPQLQQSEQTGYRIDPRSPYQQPGVAGLLQPPAQLEMPVAWPEADQRRGSGDSQSAVSGEPGNYSSAEQRLPYPDPAVNAKPREASGRGPVGGPRDTRSRPSTLGGPGNSSVYATSAVHDNQRPYGDISDAKQPGTAPSTSPQRAPVYLRSRASFAEALAQLPILEDQSAEDTPAVHGRRRAPKAQRNTGPYRWPSMDEPDEPEDLEELVEPYSQTEDEQTQPDTAAYIANTRKASNPSAPVVRRGPRRLAVNCGGNRYGGPEDSGQRNRSSLQRDAKNPVKVSGFPCVSLNRGGFKTVSVAKRRTTMTRASHSLPTINTKVSLARPITHLSMEVEQARHPVQGRARWKAVRPPGSIREAQTVGAIVRHESAHGAVIL